MLKGRNFLFAALIAVLGVGCGVIAKDPVDRTGLRYDPVNYERLDRNGTVVYRLSAEGRQAVQEDDSDFEKDANKRWWQIW